MKHFISNTEYKITNMRFEKRLKFMKLFIEFVTVQTVLFSPKN
jgi:hypothetical protein